MRKTNIVGVDYYWYSSSIIGFRNERVDECDRTADPNCMDILIAQLWDPNYFRGHNNWRSFPSYTDLGYMVRYAEGVGESKGFYFDWEDAELVMIHNVAEVMPWSPIGSGDITIITDTFYVEKRDERPPSGGGGGGGGGGGYYFVESTGLELNSTNIMAILVTIVFVIIILGFFKFFARKT